MSTKMLYAGLDSKLAPGGCEGLRGDRRVVRTEICSAGEGSGERRSTVQVQKNKAPPAGMPSERFRLLEQIFKIEHVLKMSS